MDNAVASCRRRRGSGAPLTIESIDATLSESVDFARRLVGHFVASATRIVEGLENRFIVVDEDGAAGAALGGIVGGRRRLCPYPELVGPATRGRR